MGNFEALYQQYSPLIESMSANFNGKFHLPVYDYEDLKQEAMLALYNAAETYVDSKNVKFGLYAKICIKNRLTSYIRSNYGLITSTEIGLEEIENQESSDRTPEEIAIDRDGLESIFRVLRDSLTSSEYDVLGLYVQGFSYSDIAVMLSRTEMSVRNAVHRIKVKIKKLSF